MGTATLSSSALLAMPLRSSTTGPEVVPSGTCSTARSGLLNESTASASPTVTRGSTALAPSSPEPRSSTSQPGIAAGGESETRCGASDLVPCSKGLIPPSAYSIFSVIVESVRFTKWFSLRENHAGFIRPTLTLLRKCYGPPCAAAQTTPSGRPAGPRPARATLPPHRPA